MKYVYLVVIHWSQRNDNIDLVKPQNLTNTFTNTWIFTSWFFRILESRAYHRYNLYIQKRLVEFIALICFNQNLIEHKELIHRELVRLERLYYRSIL